MMRSVGSVLLPAVSVGLLSIPALGHTQVVTYPPGSTNPGPIVLSTNTAQLGVASGVATQSGVISQTGGSRGFTKTGTGTLVLTAANTYTGATLIRQGGIRVENDNAFGAGAIYTFDTVISYAPGIVLSNRIVLAEEFITSAAGRFQVDSGTATQAGNVTGGGDLRLFRKQGAGTLILTGNVAAFRINIDGGTLQVGDGGVVGSINNAPIMNNGSVVFNRADAVSYGAGISGSGTFAKAGAGTLTLTGVHTMTGGSSVREGTLLVNGSFANSAFTVLSGATLGGTGTVGPTVVSAGGSLDAGTTGPGALRVSGPLTFAPGSNLLVDLTPVTSDRVTASGALTINGGTVSARYAAGDYIAKRYLIASGSSRSGSFDSIISTGLPSAFVSRLSYDATSAYIDLSLQLAALPGLSQNGMQVASAIDDYFDTSGSIPAVYGSLTAPQIAQLTGEESAAAGRLGLTNMDVFIDSLPSSASARASKGWRVWGGTAFRNGAFDGDTATGSTNTDLEVRQVLAGAEKAFSANTHIGAAVGWSRSDFALSGGRQDVNAMQAGVYGRAGFGRAYLSAALAYGRQDASTFRVIRINGVDGLQADVEFDSWGGRLEAGMEVVPGFAPFVAAEAAAASLPSYSERVQAGSNAFALEYAPNEISANRYEAGARLRMRREGDDGVFEAHGLVSAIYDTGDVDATAGFVALPGARFGVTGAGPDGAGGRVSLGARMNYANGWTVGVQAAAEAGETSSLYGGELSVGFSW